MSAPAATMLQYPSRKHGTRPDEEIYDDEVYDDVPPPLPPKAPRCVLQKLPSGGATHQLAVALKLNLLLRQMKEEREMFQQIMAETCHRLSPTYFAEQHQQEYLRQEQSQQEEAQREQSPQEQSQQERSQQEQSEQEQARHVEAQQEQVQQEQHNQSHPNMVQHTHTQEEQAQQPPCMQQERSPRKQVWQEQAQPQNLQQEQRQSDQVKQHLKNLQPGHKMQANQQQQPKRYQPKPSTVLREEKPDHVKTIEELMGSIFSHGPLNGNFTVNGNFIVNFDVQEQSHKTNVTLHSDVQGLHISKNEKSKMTRLVPHGEAGEYRKERYTPEPKTGTTSEQEESEDLHVVVTDAI